MATDIPHTDRPLGFSWQAQDDTMARIGLAPVGHRGYEMSRSSIVAAVALAAETGEAVSYSRRKDWYAQAGRYEGTAFTYNAVTSSVAELVGHGLVDEERALPGDHLRTQRQSRIRATPRLIELLGDARFTHRGPACSVIMKDEDGRLMALPDTDRAMRMRRETDGLNEWLGTLDVTVSPDASPDDWQRTRHHLRARKVRDGRETWACTLPTPTPHVVRILGRGRFDCHGRLYGWWQGLPKDRRRELLINGELLVEPDFEHLHPTLLYAMAGARLTYDPYETGTYPRQHGKWALNIAVNADGGLKGAVDALMAKPDWTGSRAYTKGLVDAVAKRNLPIARYLGSDAGVGLMAVDSRMAVDVLKACRKADVPCLPVHDSFMAPAKSEVRVTAIMQEVLDATRARISPVSSTTSFNRVPQMPPQGAAAPAETVPSPLPAEPVETPRAEPVPALLSPSEPLSPGEGLYPVGKVPRPAEPLPALLDRPGRSPLPGEGRGRVAPEEPRPAPTPGPVRNVVPFLPADLWGDPEPVVPVPSAPVSRRAPAPPPVPAAPSSAAPAPVPLAAPPGRGTPIVVDLAPTWGIVETDPDEHEPPAGPVYGVVAPADPGPDVPAWLVEIGRRMSAGMASGRNAPAAYRRTT